MVTGRIFTSHFSLDTQNPLLYVESRFTVEILNENITTLHLSMNKLSKKKKRIFSFLEMQNLKKYCFSICQGIYVVYKLLSINCFQSFRCSFFFFFFLFLLKKLRENKMVLLCVTCLFTFSSVLNFKWRFFGTKVSSLPANAVPFCP